MGVSPAGVPEGEQQIMYILKNIEQHLPDVTSVTVLSSDTDVLVYSLLSLESATAPTVWVYRNNETVNIKMLAAALNRQHPELVSPSFAVLFAAGTIVFGNVRT